MVVILFVLFCMLQVCDVYTTKRILDTRIGHEANPVMAWLIRNTSPLAGLVIPKIVVVSLSYYFLRDSPAVMLGLCAVYVWVINNNLKVLRK